MGNSTTDGLGFEEVNQTVTGTATISGTDVFAAGSVTAPVGTVTTLTNTTLLGTTGSFSGQISTTDDFVLGAGSPYGQGVVVPLTARSNISGGMFVSASGGLAYAAPADTLYPLGIAQPGTDVASGGTVQVITHGVAAVIAEAAVKVGEGCIMGGGGALNTVTPADTSSGLRVFGVLQAAGSEGTTFILL